MKAMDGLDAIIESMLDQAKQRAFGQKRRGQGLTPWAFGVRGRGRISQGLSKPLITFEPKRVEPPKIEGIKYPFLRGRKW